MTQKAFDKKWKALKPGEKSPDGDEWELDAAPLDANTPLSVLINKPVYKLGEDKKGHDMFLGARFPKEVGRWVQRILEKKGSPYVVRSDVTRDAIMLGLQILSLRYDLSPEWKALEQLAEISSILEDETSVYKIEGEFASNLRKLVDNGRVTLAKELLARKVDTLNRLEHALGNRPYREIMKKCLTRADLGHLLEGVDL